MSVVNRSPVGEKESTGAKSTSRKERVGHREFVNLERGEDQENINRLPR